LGKIFLAHASVEDVNDYLCQNVEPDESKASTFVVINTLIEGKGVCEGYSDAFWMLMDILNIDCQCVYGGGNHEWNIVKIDGEWYNIDVTWNDGLRNKYFLISDAKLESCCL
jgi:transglutaminase/protease-like cytokinesis protein 3